MGGVFPPLCLTHNRMPKFSTKSTKILNSCDEDLIAIFNEAIRYIDFSVIEGHRTVKRQKQLKAAGLSKTMSSKHLQMPSKAIDIAPYPINFDDRERIVYFAGIIKGIAFSKGIPLTWGGDWNNDTEVYDNQFDDLLHFELNYE